MKPFGNPGPRGYTKLGSRCYAKTSPSPSKLLGETSPSIKAPLGNQPRALGRDGPRICSGIKFPNGVKVLLALYWQNDELAERSTRGTRGEARSRDTATSRARGLETTALEAEAFEMKHLEASMCPAEMAMSEPSGAGEPSGAAGDAQARASGSKDEWRKQPMERRGRHQEATASGASASRLVESCWVATAHGCDCRRSDGDEGVQVGRELLGSHSHGCDCRRSDGDEGVQVGRELLSHHSYGATAGGAPETKASRLVESCWVTTATVRRRRPGRMRAAG